MTSIENADKQEEQRKMRERVSECKKCDGWCDRKKRGEHIDKVKKLCDNKNAGEYKLELKQFIAAKSI